MLYIVKVVSTYSAAELPSDNSRMRGLPLRVLTPNCQNQIQTRNQAQIYANAERSLIRPVWNVAMALGINAISLRETCRIYMLPFRRACAQLSPAATVTRNTSLHRARKTPLGVIKICILYSVDPGITASATSSKRTRCPFSLLYYTLFR